MCQKGESLLCDSFLKFTIFIDSNNYYLEGHTRHNATILQVGRTPSHIFPSLYFPFFISTIVNSYLTDWGYDIAWMKPELSINKM